MRLSNWAAVISFEGESPGGGVDETRLVLIGRRVGTLLDRFCLAEGVGESAGEDKKVWPCSSEGGENCRSFDSGKRSCTDRRFGTFAEATGLGMSQPWS
jgi:uracil-DNA glycosylase